MVSCTSQVRHQNAYAVYVPETSFLYRNFQKSEKPRQPKPPAGLFQAVMVHALQTIAPKKKSTHKSVWTQVKASLATITLEKTTLQKMTAAHRKMKGILERRPEEIMKAVPQTIES